MELSPDTPKFRSTRSLPSVVWLMMLPLAMAPLGTIASLFSGVSSVVVKIRISFTWPVTPCATIGSLTL